MRLSQALPAASTRESCDLYLVWGSNVAATRFPTLKDLTQARKSGKKIILIEVYAEPMAPYCDEIILIRPGSDGALALAMMHVLAENDLADEAFLKEYGLGYEELRIININRLSLALTGKDAQPALKSLYVSGGNPANSVSNQKGVLEGLAREDLFTVVHERFMTDTARYADIILPATFSMEQSDCYEAYGYCTMAAAKKIIDPPKDAKSNWNTVTLLAKAMGYTDPYFQATEEEMYEKLIQTPTPLSARLTKEERAALLKGGVISMPFADHTDIKTPDKKFYIVNPNLSEPMPHYTESYGGAEDLYLISVPSRYTLNSIFQTHKKLSENRGPMILVMNTEDTRVRGIEDGSTVLCGQ